MPMRCSDTLRYLCRNRGLCALALLVLLIIQALVVYVTANHSGQVSFMTFANTISDMLLPNVVDVNKGLAALGAFFLLELSLLTCAFIHLREGERRETSRRLGRSLIALALLFILGFVLLQSWLRSLKFSVFWASDCSEYAAAERLRLADFTADLQAARHLVSNTSSQSPTGCKMYIAINAVPNRTHRYLSQTVGSLLRSLSPREVLEICQIEILSDAPSEELQDIEVHRLEPLVEIVYNPEHRQTPARAKHSRQSWQKGSILHYLYAMERCVWRQAEYCLVLDDDTLASQRWLSEVLQNIKDLEQGHYGSEGEHWTMLKLFQPVWGNVRQIWRLQDLYLLFLLASFAAIPCGLLTILCRCSVLTPSFWFWSSAGFVAAVYVLWTTGKANLDWIVGDAAVHPYGTCHMAQANLFHRARAEAAGFLQHLANHTASKSKSFIDLWICSFFEQRRHLGPMWATSPSLFQHAGLMTSLREKRGQRSCRIRIFTEGVWRQSSGKLHKTEDGKTY